MLAAFGCRAAAFRLTNFRAFELICMERVRELEQSGARCRTVENFGDLLRAGEHERATGDLARLLLLHPAQLVQRTIEF